ncbi:UNVERIFIED_CONTAM: PspC domain-containing protein, partial [Bacillus thuringiensis]
FFITYATFVLMVSFHILKKSKSPIEFYR